jgi:hypothetical protein
VKRASSGRRNFLDRWKIEISEGIRVWKLEEDRWYG